VPFLADNRFAIDPNSGHADPDPAHEKASAVADLAGVTERTVRNALSRGELTSQREEGETYIPVSQARTFIMNSRGFVPPRSTPNEVQVMHTVSLEELQEIQANSREILTINVFVFAIQTIRSL